METESLKEIIIRRKEIEQELSKYLKKTRSNSSLDDIKKIIYNEEGQDDLTDIVMMFDVGQGASEMNTILETINDAWNYFPHKIINGLSPVEMLLRHRESTD